MKKNSIFISLLLSIFLIFNLTGCPGTIEEVVDDGYVEIPDQSNTPDGTDDNGTGNGNGGTGGPTGPSIYTVTFDSDGGSEVSAQSVKYGEYATAPEDPVREGYIFCGWYQVRTDGTLEDRKYDFASQVYGNITLKAVWQIPYHLKAGNDIHSIFAYGVHGIKAKHFAKAENAPESVEFYLDLAERDVPVWYDTAAETIYYYIPEDKKLILNEDSHYMFGMNFTSLESIDTSDFDTSNVINMHQMFYNCSSLETIDLSSFDTSNVTDMSEMFYYSSKLKELDLSSFDTRNVTTMSAMFAYCPSLETIKFYPDITDGENGAGESSEQVVDSFNTSNVTDMSLMFTCCYKLKEIDCSKFDTSNVTNMYYMFNSCYVLETLDLSSFNTSKVETMRAMFSRCKVLTTIEGLDTFNTSRVTDMGSMFSECEKLSSLVLSSFNTSNVKYMDCMFAGCYTLTTLDLTSFDTRNVEDMSDMFNLKARNGQSALTTITFGPDFVTSKVTSMKKMFYGCEKLGSINLSTFDTSRVTDMESMFCYCYSLEELDLSAFKTSNVTTMKSMFSMASVNDTNPNLEEIVFSNSFDTSNVTDMSMMFYRNKALKSLDLSHFDTSKVTDMSYMFCNCSTLSKIIIMDGFDTSNVTNMYSMFAECPKLTELDLSGFNTENVTTMENMFDGCKALTSLKIPFDTEKVESMQRMFNNCWKIEELDISSFTVSEGVNVKTIFNCCNALKTIYTKPNADWSNTEYDDLMFYSCVELVGGNGTAYKDINDDCKTGVEYARVDSADHPGYFTAKN